MTVLVAKHLIERQKEAYGWEFIFLGANIDAVQTAAQFGIARDRAQTYLADAQGSRVVYDTVAQVTTAFRSAPVGARWPLTGAPRSRKTARSAEGSKRYGMHEKPTRMNTFILEHLKTATIM